MPCHSQIVRIVPSSAEKQILLHLSVCLLIGILAFGSLITETTGVHVSDPTGVALEI